MDAKEETINLGRMILRQSDLEIPVIYKGEVFTLKYPTPAMQTAIEADIARRLGGYPRTSFSVDHVASVEACVTVDFTIIADKSPKWFKNVWGCYDEELIATLFEGYLSFRRRFQEKLRTGGFEEVSKK